MLPGIFLIKGLTANSWSGWMKPSGRMRIERERERDGERERALVGIRPVL